MRTSESILSCSDNMKEFRRDLGKSYVYPLGNRTRARIVCTGLCQSIMSLNGYGFSGM